MLHHNKFSSGSSSKKSSRNENLRTVSSPSATPSHIITTAQKPRIFRNLPDIVQDTSADTSLRYSNEILFASAVPCPIVKAEMRNRKRKKKRWNAVTGSRSRQPEDEGTPSKSLSLRILADNKSGTTPPGTKNWTVTSSPRTFTKKSCYQPLQAVSKVLSFEKREIPVPVLNPNPVFSEVYVKTIENEAHVAASHRSHPVVRGFAVPGELWLGQESVDEKQKTNQMPYEQDEKAKDQHMNMVRSMQDKTIEEQQTEEIRPAIPERKTSGFVENGGLRHKATVTAENDSEASSLAEDRHWWMEPVMLPVPKLSASTHKTHSSDSLCGSSATGCQYQEGGIISQLQSALRHSSGDAARNPPHMRYCRKQAVTFLLGPESKTNTAFSSSRTPRGYARRRTRSGPLIAEATSEVQYAQSTEIHETAQGSHLVKPVIEQVGRPTKQESGRKDDSKPYERVQGQMKDPIAKLIADEAFEAAARSDKSGNAFPPTTVRLELSNVVPPSLHTPTKDKVEKKLSWSPNRWRKHLSFGVDRRSRLRPTSVPGLQFEEAKPIFLTPRSQIPQYPAMGTLEYYDAQKNHPHFVFDRDGSIVRSHLTDKIVQMFQLRMPRPSWADTIPDIPTQCQEMFGGVGILSSDVWILYWETLIVQADI